MGLCQSASGEGKRERAPTRVSCKRAVALTVEDEAAVDPNGSRGGALLQVFPKVKGMAAEGAGGFSSDAIGGGADPDAPKLKIPVRAPAAGAGVLPNAAVGPAPEVPKEKAEKVVEAAGPGSGTFDALPKAKTPAPESVGPAGLASKDLSVEGVAAKPTEDVAPTADASKLKAGACDGASARAAGAGASDAAGAALPKRKGALGCVSGGDCCESGVLPKMRGANDGVVAVGAGVVGPAADPPNATRPECDPSPAGPRLAAGSATGLAVPNVKAFAGAGLGAGFVAGWAVPKVKVGAATGLGATSTAGVAPPKLKIPLEGRLGGARPEGTRAGSGCGAGFNPKDIEGVDGGAGGNCGVEAAVGAGLAPVQAAGLRSLEKL